MQIIEELEPTPRGVYGGAVGYIGLDGDMDLCIAIRTLHLHDGFVDLQAGAGVVADSDPQLEWQETLNKAAALLASVLPSEPSP
jgi:anthranilate synthase component 1